MKVQASTSNKCEHITNKKNADMQLIGRTNLGYQRPNFR